MLSHSECFLLWSWSIWKGTVLLDLEKSIHSHTHTHRMRLVESNKMEVWSSEKSEKASTEGQNAELVMVSLFARKKKKKETGQKWYKKRKVQTNGWLVKFIFNNSFRNEQNKAREIWKCQEERPIERLSNCYPRSGETWAWNYESPGSQIPVLTTGWHALFFKV